MLHVLAQLSEVFFECREVPVGNSSNTAFVFIFPAEEDQALTTAVSVILISKTIR